MEVRFEYSAFAKPLEEQANQYGYTLGEHAEFVHKINFGLEAAYIHGCITPSEYNRILRKFQDKVIVPCLKPLEESEE